MHKSYKYHVIVLTNAYTYVILALYYFYTRKLRIMQYILSTREKNWAPESNIIYMTH